MEKLKNFFKRIKWQGYLASSIMIILGVIFIVAPHNSLGVICRITGIMAIVWGVISLIGYFSGGMRPGSRSFLSGAALLISGIYFTIRPDVLSGVLTIVFGIIIMTDGFKKIQHAIDGAREKVKNWWILLVIAVVTILLALFILLNPFSSAKTFMVFSGISLLVNGVGDLISTIAFGRKLRRAEKIAKITSEGVELEEDV